MAPYDGTAALPDIAGDQPAGENLEYDPDFAELERLAQGKPEQQYGSTVVPAEEPDWKQVAAAAAALMERTYDLRVMVLLALARLQRDGVPAFAGTVGMIHGALRSRWSALHPQLDPDDDNDPMLRANALLALAEPARVLRVLRTVPLARSVRAGAVCWRDVAIAQGTLEVDEETPRMAEAVIAAAFRETDAEQLAALRAALQDMLEHAAGIVGVFNDEAGYGTGPDFSELEKLLRDALRMIDGYAGSSASAAELPGEEAAGAGAEGPGTAAPAAGSAPRSAPVMSIATMGPPTNRDDAMRLLDLVIEFYERHEPSSPLPLLIGRARRLADKGFLDILRDMAPDGVSQAEMIAGRPEY